MRDVSRQHRTRTRGPRGTPVVAAEPPTGRVYIYLNITVKESDGRPIDIFTYEQNAPHVVAADSTAGRRRRRESNGSESLP